MTADLYRLPHDAATVAAKRREIDRRYAKQAAARPYSRDTRIMRFRCRDLEKFYRGVHGDMLPNNAIGRDLLFVMAHTIFGRNAITGRGGQTLARIVAWAQKWCPWMPRHDAETLAERVIARPLRWTADSLGKRLGLTDAMRTALGITTIGSMDVSKAKRLARRRERNNAAKAAKRRAAGAKPRAVSAARTRPWEAWGICRRTWERRGKPLAPKPEMAGASRCRKCGYSILSTCIGVAEVATALRRSARRSLSDLASRAPFGAEGVKQDSQRTTSDIIRVGDVSGREEATAASGLIWGHHRHFSPD